MDLLIDLVLAVLSKIIGYRLDRMEAGQDASRYPTRLTTLLLFIAWMGLLTGLISFPLGLFSVMLLLEYPQTWPGIWVYPALMLLLPFLNLGVLIWIRNPPPNPKAVAAAIGMVVSLNLPVWVSPWLSSGSQPGFGPDTFVLAFCLLTFTMAAVLFIWSGWGSHPTPIRDGKHRKPASRKISKASRKRSPIEEPDFLNAADHLNTRKQKPSYSEREPRHHF